MSGPYAEDRRRPASGRRNAVLVVLLILAATRAPGQWNVAHFGSGQLTNPFDVRIGAAFYRVTGQPQPEP
jgi:hypothetical protein